MKPNFTKLDYMLAYYIADDELRPAICKAYTDDEDAYASDSHTLIRISKRNIAGNYPDFREKKDVPNFSKFINEQREKTKFAGVISINELLPCIENIKVKLRNEKLQKDCDNCNGDGEIECSCCGHESECKECKGKGYHEHNGKIVIRDVVFTDEDGEEIRRISIHDRHFSPKYTELIMLTMLILNVEKCNLYLNDDAAKPMAIFHIEEYDVEILLMGLSKN